MRKLTITYNPDHLGDISQDEYADAVEEAIGEYFGGEYEYRICPGSVLSTTIDLEGSWPASHRSLSAALLPRRLLQVAYSLLCAIRP